MGIGFGSGSHTDAAFVRALLSPRALARTEGPIEWSSRPPRYTGKVAVSAPGVRIGGRLELTANELRGGELWIAYIADEGWVRRLCVNQEHRPFVGTHKHRVETRGEECYEPDDIPPLELSPTTPCGSYREVLIAFAQECHITVGDDLGWTDPWGGAR